MQFHDVDIERLVEMTDSELDNLAFGTIVLDAEYRVVSYNKAEQTLARRSAKRTIGRHFFKDVAPCTDNDAFKGRLDNMLKERRKTETFDFIFQFPWGHQEVRVRFWVGSQGNVFVFVSPLGEPVSTSPRPVG